jgi:hypothetical protein
MQKMSHRIKELNAKLYDHRRFAREKFTLPALIGGEYLNNKRQGYIERYLP